MIVERIILPPDIRRGQPFDLKVVVTNTRQATEKDPGEASGRLKIKRRIDQESSEIINQAVKLPPGKHVFTVRQQLDSAGFFTYDAEFARDGREEGIARKSNRASAYTFLQGKGQVLLIEDYEHPGQYKGLIAGPAEAQRRGAADGQRPLVRQPGRASAVRFDHLGRCSPRALYRRADPHAARETRSRWERGW